MHEIVVFENIDTTHRGLREHYILQGSPELYLALSNGSRVKSEDAFVYTVGLHAKASQILATRSTFFEMLTDTSTHPAMLAKYPILGEDDLEHRAIAAHMDVNRFMQQTFNPKCEALLSCMSGVGYFLPVHTGISQDEIVGFKMGVNEPYILDSASLLLGDKSLLALPESYYAQQRANSSKQFAEVVK